MYSAPSAALPCGLLQLPLRLLPLPLDASPREKAVEATQAAPCLVVAQGVLLMLLPPPLPAAAAQERAVPAAQMLPAPAALQIVLHSGRGLLDPSLLAPGLMTTMLLVSAPLQTAAGPHKPPARPLQMSCAAAWPGPPACCSSTACD